MKLLKLALCVSLILSSIGCVTNREAIIAQPIPPVEPSATVEGTESQPVTAPAERPHPIRGMVQAAERMAAIVIAAPVVLSMFLIFGGIPMTC